MPHLDRFRLDGRVALVTGGSKGLGKAMARGFAEAGANLVLCSRNAEELNASLAHCLEGTGREGLAVVADLSKRSESERLAKAALERFGHVDIFVNNAGSNVPQAVDAITDEVWDRILELNLSSGMAICRAVTPGMKERRWGRILHISSIMGLASKEERSIYSATKSSLLGLARSQALDLGEYGVTVNCVAPGPFLTDLPGKMLTDAQKAVFTSRTALGRWGDPNELVGPALLLCSDAGSYITGTCLTVDGGTLVKTF
jgi:NAD(P)-dependent dehydrogenase (short-subunit alcohol dehydrogenase family)